MNFGVIYNESFGDYRATDCVGSHRLDDLTPYPIRYYLRHITRELAQREDTPAFRFGRLVHAMALEGQSVVEQRYCAIPADAPTPPTGAMLEAEKPSAKSKARIDWWDNFTVQANGRELVEAADMATATAMIETIRAKPCAAELFTTGRPEVTFRHKLASFGIQSRVDWFVADAQPAPMLVDLKTIDSLEQFDYQYEKYGYYKQAAFYRLVVAKVLGVPPSTLQFTFVVVEKNKPHLVARRDPDAASLEAGEAQVIADLTLLKQCYESGKWPGSPDSATGVSLPEWKTKNLTH